MKQVNNSSNISKTTPRYEATGTIFTANNTNLEELTQYHTFGIQSLKVIEIRTGLIYDLPDKFYVSEPTLAQARQEFFARWRIYIERKFHVSYIPIEIYQ